MQKPIARKRVCSVKGGDLFHLTPYKQMNKRDIFYRNVQRNTSDFVCQTRWTSLGNTAPAPLHIRNSVHHEKTL